MTWIKVSDKLPPKEGRYLCWAEGWFGAKIVHFSYEHEEGYLWYSEDDCYGVTDPLIEQDGDILPTHWSVLELPKEAK